MMLSIKNLLKTLSYLPVQAAVSGLLFLSMNASAGTNPDALTPHPPMAEAGTCADCQDELDPMGNLRLTLRIYEKTFQNLSRIEDMEEISARLNWSNRCDHFIKADAYGVWGETIADEIRKPGNEKFYQGTKDIETYCPDFQLMSKSQKEDVWILILNAMAHYESSCDKTAKAKGPNGQLKGIMQLHALHEARYAPGCKDGDSFNARASLRCSISMLNKQFNTSDLLFDKGSYWDVLVPRGLGGKTDFIKTAIRSFPICHPPAPPTQTPFYPTQPR